MHKVEKIEIKLIVTVNGVEYESNTTTAITICEYCVANNSSALCSVLLPYCKVHPTTYFTARENK